MALRIRKVPIFGFAVAPFHFSVSVFDVRMVANRQRLLCSSPNDSQKAAVHADVENQSKLTHQARPGSGETQLSAVRTVSAAGFGARTLVLALSHVAVRICSSERSWTTTCRRIRKIVGATRGGAATTRLRRCFELGIADDAARPPLEVLAGLMAAIQSVRRLLMAGDTTQGGQHNQRKVRSRTCTNSTAMSLCRVAAAKTLALTVQSWLPSRVASECQCGCCRRDDRRKCRDWYR